MGADPITTSYKRRYSQDERDRAVITGAAITKALEDYRGPGGEGMSTRDLSDATGLAQTTVCNFRSGKILPGRETLRFVLDVLDADRDMADRALAAASSRSSHSATVRRRMVAFYGARRGDATPLTLVPPEPPAPTTGALPLVRRQEAVDAVIDSLVALVNVGWDDVIEWLEVNGRNLAADRRDAVMRTIWGS